MSGLESIMKRMGLRSPGTAASNQMRSGMGGQRALRSPAMRTSLMAAGAMGGAESASSSPSPAPGMPQMSDDPQSQAFAGLVSHMLPGLNLPMLNSAAPSPVTSMKGGATEGPFSSRDRYAHRGGHPPWQKSVNLYPPPGINRGPMEDGTYEDRPDHAHMRPGGLGPQQGPKREHQRKAAAALGVTPAQIAAAETADWDTLGNDKVEWSDLAAIGRYMVGGVGKGLSWLGEQLSSVMDGADPSGQTTKVNGAPEMKPGATFGQTNNVAPGVPQGGMSNQEWKEDLMNKGYIFEAHQGYYNIKGPDGNYLDDLEIKELQKGLKAQSGKKGR